MLLTFDEYEMEAYNMSSKRHKRRLFVRSENDPNKFHWHMGKLRKLVLFTTWLGFLFLSNTLTVGKVPQALRLIEEGKLVDLWMGTIYDKQHPSQDSDMEAFYRRAKTHINANMTAKLEYILRGSPKMRVILPIIRDKVLLRKEQSIVWIMWLAEQVYVAAVLKEAGISYLVFHASLDTSQRTQMINLFIHDTEKVRVLISSYSVNSAVLNLQNLCRNVHLLSPATSSAILDQAIGRICRFGQRHVVLVYDYQVQKTINTVILNRNNSKALPFIVMDMALGGENDVISSDLQHLNLWRIRGYKPVQFQEGEDPLPDDIFDPDVVLEKTTNALEGKEVDDKHNYEWNMEESIDFK